MLKLSIIVLSWNTKDLLCQCLNSLLASGDWEKQTEVIVVDNGSNDGSPVMVKKGFPKVKLIQNKENLGFAKGNNIGLREAKGEYVMLLNSDTVVEKGAIGELGRYLDEHQEVAAVAPLILNEDGSIQKDPCFLKLPSPLTVFLYYNPILRKVVFKFFPRLLLSTNDFEKPSEVEQLPGAAVVIRSKILKEIGGLDGGYPHYFEDTDLSFRLRKQSYRLVLVPQSRIVHLGRRSIQPVIKKEGVERFYYLNFHGLFLFCQKNYPPPKTTLIKIIVFFQLLLTGKISLIKKLWQ
jgi:hypothetical protein